LRSAVRAQVFLLMTYHFLLMCNVLAVANSNYSLLIYRLK
jgi:hypothetical protein